MKSRRELKPTATSFKLKSSCCFFILSLMFCKYQFISYVFLLKLVMVAHSSSFFYWAARIICICIWMYNLKFTRVLRSYSNTWIEETNKRSFKLIFSYNKRLTAFTSILSGFWNVSNIQYLGLMPQRLLCDNLW